MAALLDRAVAAGRSKPDWAYPYFLFAKALAAYRQGRLDNAIAELRGEASLMPGPNPRMLLAMAQFHSWQAVLGVFVCLNVIQFVVGSYVEPRVSGNVLAISPFVVLFATFLWTYLWGLFGTFIGVPMALAILTFCAQHPASRWLADLLGQPLRSRKRHG